MRRPLLDEIRRGIDGRDCHAPGRGQEFAARAPARPAPKILSLEFPRHVRRAPAKRFLHFANVLPLARLTQNLFDSFRQILESEGFLHDDRPFLERFRAI